MSDDKPPSPSVASASSSAEPSSPDAFLEEVFTSIASGLDGQNRVGAAILATVKDLPSEVVHLRSSAARVEDRLSSQHQVLDALLAHARVEDKSDAAAQAAIEGATQILRESEVAFKRAIDDSKRVMLEEREADIDSISVTRAGIRGRLRWITVITYAKIYAVPLAVKIVGAIAAGATALYAVGRARGWWH